CRPPGNRDPRPDEVAACWPWLEAKLDALQPKVVITLGNFASKRLLETDVGITKLRGKAYPFRGGWLVPTFHPAAALRGGRFGGMDPVDAIRADLKVAATELTAAAAREEIRLEEPDGSSRRSAKEEHVQEGLF
ncbi:MAG TPA: uracil-DNA glycosylase, partial [Actinomycetota bacterium]|nr:uracil-DNA glycosylase [Actinomycetota bacterium]